MDRDRPRERVAEARRGEGGAKVPYPIRIRRLEVTGTRRIGPAMLRLTLGGPELAGFESHSVVDEHVKLVFPDPDGGLRVPEQNGLMLSWPKPMPPTRDYTVRRYDAERGELDLDVVLHPGGLASEWAARVGPGEPVWVAGPPAGLAVPERYDHYLLAGDTTALPAIARWVENMPPDTRGWVFVEVADAGLGMDTEDLDDANARLEQPVLLDSSVPRQMGLFVVGALARRHGITARLLPGRVASSR